MRRQRSSLATVQDALDDVIRLGHLIAHIDQERADGFRPGLKQSRREALWTLKGLRNEPLALFAAAAAREAEEAVITEQVEPEMALRPMTGGREVVED